MLELAQSPLLESLRDLLVRQKEAQVAREARPRAHPRRACGALVVHQRRTYGTPVARLWSAWAALVERSWSALQAHGALWKFMGHSDLRGALWQHMDRFGSTWKALDARGAL